LADASAPTGRPLRAGERREVTWTLSEPRDLRLPEGPERRRRRVARLASEAAAAGCAPTVADLAGALGVSPATVKRDLAQLRRDGHEIRTRGATRPNR
jgi:biotin operon repressor